ncbi:MAG: hypothetical protein ACPGC9_01885, partial [Cytophagales bacterium]
VHIQNSRYKGITEEFLTYLCKQGMDLNAVDCEGKTCLYNCVTKYVYIDKDPENLHKIHKIFLMTTWLLKKGADTKAPFGGQLNLEAMIQKFYKIIHKMNYIAHQEKVQEGFKKITTAIYSALDLLLERGVDINARYDGVGSPCHVACVMNTTIDHMNSRTEKMGLKMITYLLEHGGNPLGRYNKNQDRMGYYAFLDLRLFTDGVLYCTGSDTCLRVIFDDFKYKKQGGLYTLRERCVIENWLRKEGLDHCPEVITVLICQWFIPNLYAFKNRRGVALGDYLKNNKHN